MASRPRRRPVQLALRAIGTHGGYRAGAGRPRGRGNHYVPHTPRPRVTRHDAVHVTLRVVADAPDLQGACCTVIDRVFAAERDGKGFRLIHFSVRPNHIHLVCEGDSTLALSRGIQRVASRIARGINRAVGRSGRLFADRFHNRVVTTPKETRVLLAYVLLNAHKDAWKARQRIVGFDPYSSAHWFDGWADARPRPPPDETPPVARPRSWVLSTGWRRAGLIRTDEKAPRSRPRQRRSVPRTVGGRCGQRTTLGQDGASLLRRRPHRADWLLPASEADR